MCWGFIIRFVTDSTYVFTCLMGNQVSQQLELEELQSNTEPKYGHSPRAQKHTHMDSSLCYGYVHQQGSRMWLSMNRMHALPIANLHMHSLAPEQMWTLTLSSHSRMTETPTVQEMPWKCSDEMVRITNKYSPETHLHTGTHSKHTGLTQTPQIPGK